jgi:hypothetical protein
LISSDVASKLPLIAVYVVLALNLGSLHAQETMPRDSDQSALKKNLNAQVLSAVEEMPVGGGYAVTRSASQALAKSISVGQNGTLLVDAQTAQPSYCSGATYIVLLKALKAEIDKIDPQRRVMVTNRLKEAAQVDGVGIWGRWNSNGPCMAVLFAESDMGFSFWDYKKALPGDFLKLWWKDPIGRDEAGHSVIFLGYADTPEGESGIEVWSSNKPSGYGKKVVSFSKIHHALFSRCEHPERVENLANLAERSEILAGMLKRNISLDEINVLLEIK